MKDYITYMTYFIRFLHPLFIWLFEGHYIENVHQPCLQCIFNKLIKHLYIYFFVPQPSFLNNQHIISTSGQQWWAVITPADHHDASLVAKADDIFLRDINI